MRQRLLAPAASARDDGQRAKADHDVRAPFGDAPRDLLRLVEPAEFDEFGGDVAKIPRGVGTQGVGGAEMFERFRALAGAARRQSERPLGIECSPFALQIFRPANGDPLNGAVRKGQIFGGLGAARDGVDFRQDVAPYFLREPTWREFRDQAFVEDGKLASRRISESHLSALIHSSATPSSLSSTNPSSEGRIN